MMETATLANPTRPLIVPPIQKSLSLPSYARASGEGIDHTIIFAALEQREKIRRKSKIFRDKEKSGSTRQNYFCLPLSSNGKCRETSLSSDTSCSSLEFQKPKCRASPTKLTNGDVNEISVQNNKISNKHSPSPVAMKACDGTQEITGKEEFMTGTRTPIRMDNSRSTIGSSDSIERTDKSSKSSNDSLTRKERLLAIKARVEAERERNLCGSSSDEEPGPRISRHNSDGHIHKTVRDVKSKSSKNDKRYRRRTQDEMAIRRALRKQHTSLYLPHTTDLDAMKSPVFRSGSSLALQKDADEFTKEFLGSNHKTYLQPILRTNSSSNHSYFSDICSSNLRSTRVVRSRVEEIELKQLETKLAKPSFKTEKPKIEDTVNHIPEKTDVNCKLRYKNSFQNSPSQQHANSPNMRYFEKDSVFSKSSPPISRAPTPPPRSPKSIEFVNKAFIQHQNVTNYLQGAHSLERKKNFFHSSGSNDNINKSSQYKLSDNVTGSSEMPLADRRNKGITNLRRRTLCNFPHMDDIISPPRPQTPTSYQRSKFSQQNFPPRSPDLTHKTGETNRKTKGYASGSDISPSRTMLQTDLTGKKWEKIELDSEKKFNSLENRSKGNISLIKDKISSNHKYPCFCVNDCQCGLQPNSIFKADEKYSKMFQIDGINNLSPKGTDYNVENNKISKSMPTSKTPPIPVDRLCKSEINLTKRSSIKTPSPKLKAKQLHSQGNITKENTEEFSFNGRNESENLDTAMKELENIYLSLKISAENLSAIDEKQQDYRVNNEISLSSESSNLSFLKNKYESLSSITFADNISSERQIKKTNETVNCLTPVPDVFAVNSETICNTLCIEELFTDLTQQLDMEQKLLQESKYRKNSNPSAPHQVDRAFRNDLSKTSTLFENDSNKFISDIIPQTKSPLPITRADIKEALLAKRRRDAVESITSKLSNVMETSAQFTNFPNKHENNQNQDLTHKQCQRNDTVQKNIVCTSLSQKSEDSDEIWQVRVSMSKNQANSSALSQNCNNLPSNYSRLRSALRLPRTSNSRDPSPCPGSPHLYEKPLNHNNNDLDKILNTLINEVPHAKNPKSSQKQIEESNYSNSITKGEMLVLQHLDLIRNIDPS